MLRVVLMIALPVMLPTALYLMWVFALHPTDGRAVGRGGVLPWIWLAAAGVALLALVLLVVTVGFGAPQRGIYVPPRYVNGHIVEGHVEPGSTR
jgi:hypothetical protein